MKNILIVDDSKSFRTLIEKILKKNGYRSLIMAERALDAYAVLGLEGSDGRLRDIDLILMDMNMPEIDGVQACARIKDDPALQDIPIIMLTGSTDMESLEEAFKAGANDYITKPPNKSELMARISSALALKEETDRRKAHAEELHQMSEKLKKANEKLKHMAAVDGLTGLSNRRSFDDYLKRVWGTAMREEEPVALIMIDIDHFKLYNDTFGHVSGDDCLRDVASAIKGAIRRSGDLVARYGGEEFAVIMPSTKLKGASFTSEKIRGAVSGLRIKHGAPGAGKHVTISVGVVTLIPRKGMKAGDLIEAADAALYRAKDGGRNRVMSIRS